MVEGLVLIGGAFAVERFALFDFAALPIHPLVFAVALIAAQYGAFGGICATLAATAFTSLAGALPARIVGEGYFEYLVAVWATPLAWLTIAVMVGIVSDGHRRARARAQREAAELRRERELILSQYDALAARARRLERVAAGFETAGLSKGGLAGSIS